MEEKENYLMGLSIEISNFYVFRYKAIDKAFLQILSSDRKVFDAWFIRKFWICPSLRLSNAKKKIFLVYTDSRYQRSITFVPHTMLFYKFGFQELFQSLISNLAWKVFWSKRQHPSSVYRTKHNASILNTFSRRCRRK